MNTFFVSCERITNSQLEGIPLIIGGGDRGVVASCSYEARRFGVRSAMPINMALKLCPQAKVMKGDIKFGGKRLKRRKRYVIIEGRHLMTKKLIGLCGPIMIGLIDDRLLILDLLSYEEIVKRDEYFVFRTIINRTILERKE